MTGIVRDGRRSETPPSRTHKAPGFYGGACPWISMSTGIPHLNKGVPGTKASNAAQNCAR